MLAHSFRGFTSWLIGLIAFEPGATEYIMVIVSGGGGISSHGSQEAKETKGSGSQ
jgi:hypothetical protein